MFMENLSITIKAVDIVADATGRDDSVSRIERRHAADRKSVAPMPIRHAERVALDAGQAGYIRHLLEHARVHPDQDGLGRVDPGRHQHPLFGGCRNLPDLLRHPVDRHRGLQFHFPRSFFTLLSSNPR